MIIGVGLASCTITATSEGIVGSVTVSVVAAPLHRSAVTTTASNIPVGITTQLNAVLRDSAGPHRRSPHHLDVRNADRRDGVVARSRDRRRCRILRSITARAPASRPTHDHRLGAACDPVRRSPSTAPSTVLQPTQSVQATAVTKDAAGNVLTGRVINWSSSNTAVASISPLGLISALAGGTTTITVTSEGKSASITITVPPVATVTVATPQTNLQPTQTTQASATLLDANSTPTLNRTITWSSTNPAVATVSAAGLVTAVASGSTSIVATSEGISGSKTINVPAVATVTVTGTNLSPTSAADHPADGHAARRLLLARTQPHCHVEQLVARGCFAECNGTRDGSLCRYGGDHRHERDEER
jgi:hypothetical protein